MLKLVSRSTPTTGLIEKEPGRGGPLIQKSSDDLAVVGNKERKCGGVGGDTKGSTHKEANERKQTKKHTNAHAQRFATETHNKITHTHTHTPSHTHPMKRKHKEAKSHRRTKVLSFFVLFRNTHQPLF